MMENDEARPAERQESDYERAFREMLEFKAAFDKLSRFEQERLITKAVPIWRPDADPLKARIIANTLKKHLK